MNFRNEIARINSDKLTIEDIDALIPVLFESVATLMYEKINVAIVETYRKNRNNHISGYFETGERENDLFRVNVDKKFSNNKYTLEYLSLRKHSGAFSDNSGNKSITNGLSISADISYDRNKIMDFVDANGYIDGRPDVHIATYKSSCRVIVDAYAIQNHLGRRFLKGDEYSFKLNKYAKLLSEYMLNLGKEDGVTITPKIGVCLNSTNNWRDYVEYFDSDSIVTIKEKNATSNRFYGEGLIFQYSTTL